VVVKTLVSLQKSDANLADKFFKKYANSESQNQRSVAARAIYSGIKKDKAWAKDKLRFLEEKDGCPFETAKKVWSLGLQDNDDENVKSLLKNLLPSSVRAVSELVRENEQVKQAVMFNGQMRVGAILKCLTLQEIASWLEIEVPKFWQGPNGESNHLSKPISEVFTEEDMLVFAKAFLAAVQEKASQESVFNQIAFFSVKPLSQDPKEVFSALVANKLCEREVFLPPAFECEI
ncbi:MAG: hypothetical protein KKH06_02575, partial [Gammaproteobacteria bacterium]|nr:hypothetical protein [Gammaproteobacteria bacterium]